MKRSNKCLTFLAGWLMAAAAHGQPVHRFPVTYYGEQIFIPVCVGEGKDTLQFVWDTGMNNTYIDSAAAAKTGVKVTGSTQSAGVVGSSNFGLAEDQVLKISSATLPPHRLSISNFSALSAATGKRIDGIIGNQLNHQFIVWLDLDNLVMELYRDFESVPSEKKGERFAFTFNQYIPVPEFNCKIRLKNGNEYTAPFLFDTGGGGITATMGGAFTGSNKLLDQLGKTYTRPIRGLTGAGSLQVAAIESFFLGAHQFSDLTATFTPPGGSGVSSFGNILGNELIYRFNILLNYPSLELYLLPNTRYKDAFPFPLSTINVAMQDTRKIITSVSPGSEAEQSGLVPGDEIVTINDYWGSDLDHIRSLLRKEGSRVSVVARDKSGAEKKVQFTPRRLL